MYSSDNSCTKLKNIKYTIEQKSVIEHDLNSHALVSAVAGSGKTQTLIARIQYLLSQEVGPSEILVLMFNKSACYDFEKRLKTLELAESITVKTFHALGFQTVSFMERKRLLSPAKLIHDGFMLNKITKEALQKTHQLLSKKEEITAELIDDYNQYVSLIKSNLNFESAFRVIASDAQSQIEVFFKFYEQIRGHYNCRTFDDLLFEPTQILQKNKRLAAQFGTRYRYVIVDEYQDINEVQQYLLRLTSATAKSVMAVGDIDQTIYEWRGSKPYYMQKGFKNDFKKAKEYNLSYTFRYGHLLSMMANEVIQYNPIPTRKLCFSDVYTAQETDVYIVNKRQLSRLIDRIQSDLKQGLYTTQEVVVLVRKYSSSVLFELSCLQAGMAYKITGGKSVFNLPLTQTIISYLHLIDGAKKLLVLAAEQQIEKIRAILAYPSLYLTIAQLNDLSQYLSEHSIQPLEAFRLFNQKHTLPIYQRQKIETRLAVWSEMIGKSSQVKASSVINTLYDLLDFKKFFAKKAEVNEVYTDNDVADAWLGFASYDNKSSEQFLTELELLAERSQHQHNIENCLMLSSIHKAKGLQWQHVILYDMTEQSFFGNGRKKIESAVDIERERRLFYVAMTRAISTLSIVAGTDTAKLSSWFEAEERGHPAGLRKTNSVRFLYESQLLKCQKGLNILDEKAKPMKWGRNKPTNLIGEYFERFKLEKKKQKK